MQDTSMNKSEIKLDYSHITENLCQNCAECCKVRLPIHYDERFYDYLVALNLDVQKNANNPSSGIINLGYCVHLDTTEGRFRCRIYDTRPKLCRDYNCVAWAKFYGAEASECPSLSHATKVYNMLHSKTLEDT